MTLYVTYMPLSHLLLGEDWLSGIDDDDCINVDVYKDEDELGHGCESGEPEWTRNTSRISSHNS